MRNDEYYLLAFNSTHAAGSAEKLLSAQLEVTIMPTLRKITASCGISLRIEDKDFEKLKAILSANTLDCSLYRVLNGEPSLL